MDTSSLTSKEADATRRAMEYWIGRWDWECPTLFGAELEEMKAVVAHWPAVGSAVKETAALCALGAWRELLQGASSPPAEDVYVLTGVEPNEAEQLSAKVFVLASKVLGRPTSPASAPGEA